MATATRESPLSVGGIPTRPVETGGIAAPAKTNHRPFVRMALESSDFACKLKPIQPVVFFAALSDERGRTVLDLFVDLGFANISGLRVRQQPGQVRLPDGKVVDGFSVSVRGVPINPQFGGTAYLSIHRDERPLPNGEVLAAGDFTIAGLNAFEVGQAVWVAYCTGQYSGIDHEKAGVRRLSSTELHAKISAAISARSLRQERREQFRQSAQMPRNDGVQDAIGVE